MNNIKEGLQMVASPVNAISGSGLFIDVLMGIQLQELMVMNVESSARPAYRFLTETITL